MLPCKWWRMHWPLILQLVGLKNNEYAKLKTLRQQESKAGKKCVKSRFQDDDWNSTIYAKIIRRKLFVQHKIMQGQGNDRQHLIRISLLSFPWSCHHEQGDTSLKRHKKRKGDMGEVNVLWEWWFSNLSMALLQMMLMASAGNQMCEREARAKISVNNISLRSLSVKPGNMRSNVVESPYTT